MYMIMKIYVIFRNIFYLIIYIINYVFKKKDFEGEEHLITILNKIVNIEIIA